jgi:hypothetical protein
MYISAWKAKQALYTALLDELRLETAVAIRGTSI